ncbi:regucalcin-like isoform X1 [Vespula maculifrons]|uniref:Regucalcin n=1 Tax=Vespula maculifrons TaxID=7453 RepID=A0ABD2CQA6_VESMC
MFDIFRFFLYLTSYFAALTDARVNVPEINENTPGITIKTVTEPFGLTEGPHWDDGSQKLYFVDIVNQKLYRLDPLSGSVTSTYIENGPVGVAVPVEDEPNKFVAGSGTDFVLVTWDSGLNLTKASSKVLSTVDKNRKNTRWNDGKVDSSGRFWGGTMGPEINGDVVPDQGTFYRIEKDFVPRVEISPVSISNGLAWNKEDDTFYYIDSPTRQIAAYDYNPLSGSISNKRIVFDLGKNNISTGVPDGMTIDTDGNLWIAVFNGSVVLNVNPKTGKLIRYIRLPAERVTSVAFGGPNLQTLYITTSSYGLSDAEKKKQPKAGCVFEVKGLGVNGLLANSFKL